MTVDDLFPPRKIGQVHPMDSVNEVLDTMASVGWDIRQAMTSKGQRVTFQQDEQPIIGTFREFWRDCPGCQKRTRWSFTQMNDYIDGTCQECDYPETFGSWDEVIEVVDER